MIYRSEGCHVYQAEKHIAACFTGHQGQTADAIAERIADLLNKDFERFCMTLAQGIEAASAAETENTGSIRKDESPVGEADAPTPSTLNRGPTHER